MNCRGDEAPLAGNSSCICARVTSTRDADSRRHLRTAAAPRRTGR